MALTGCNKDAEVNAFITENRAVIDEIVKKVDANPSEAGVDEAQKAFDAKKAALKEKWDAIKTARGAQVSTEVQNKFNTEVLADMKKLTDVQQKHSAKLSANGGAGRQKLLKLVQAYADVIKM